MDLKGKGYCKELNKMDYNENIKVKAAVTIVHALRESPRRVCNSAHEELINMLHLLDYTHPSDREENIIEVRICLTTLINFGSCSNNSRRWEKRLHQRNAKLIFL